MSEPEKKTNVEKYHLSKSFEMLRPYLREFYVGGYNDKSNMPVKGGTAYTDILRRIEKSKGDRPEYRQEEHKKVYYLPIDSRDGRHNPLFPYWRLSSFTDAQLVTYFIVLDALNSPGKEMSYRELMNYVTDVYNKWDSRNPGTELNEDQLKKELKRLADVGILNRRLDKRKVWYSRAADIAADGCRDALDFFSEAAPCGVIASLMPGWDNEAESSFCFKHHYITDSLDSEVLAGLFYAIRRGYAVTVENTPQNAASGETETLRLLPLKIYISVQTGRQYVMAYDMDEEIIKALRIDKIGSLDFVSEETQLFAGKRAELDGKAPYLFGVSSPQKTQPVKVSFTVEAGPGEDYIVERLMREKRQGTVDGLPSSDGAIRLYRYEAEVYDERELIPWVRTFTGRLREVNFPSQEIQSRFDNGFSEVLGKYGIRTYAGEEKAAPRRNWDRQIAKASAAPSVKLPEPPPLFCDTCSAVYAAVTGILNAARNTRIPMTYHEAKKIVSREILLDGIEIDSLLTEGLGIRKKPSTDSDSTPLYPLLRCKGLSYVPALCCYDEVRRPLTTAERQWLRAILDDPRMALFENERISDLRERLKDVEPLYRQEDVVYFDRYADGDPYGDEGYRTRFGTILKALREKSPLSVTYTDSRGKTMRMTVMPERLEYSEKDDKFRLRCCGDGRFLNLKRVTDCTPADEEPNRETPPAEQENCTAVILIHDRDNARERVLFNFAHFERETERLDENTYRMDLRYARSDEKELAIRLLSFGSYVQVTEPASLRDEVISRLKKQAEIQNI